MGEVGGWVIEVAILCHAAQGAPHVKMRQSFLTSKVRVTWKWVQRNALCVLFVTLIKFNSKCKLLVVPDRLAKKVER